MQSHPGGKFAVGNAPGSHRQHHDRGVGVPDCENTAVQAKKQFERYERGAFVPSMKGWFRAMPNAYTAPSSATSGSA
jgi:hypothetical protein